MLSFVAETAERYGHGHPGGNWAGTGTQGEGGGGSLGTPAGLSSARVVVSLVSRFPVARGCCVLGPTHRRAFAGLGRVNAKVLFHSCGFGISIGWRDLGGTSPAAWAAPSPALGHPAGRAGPRGIRPTDPISLCR